MTGTVFLLSEKRTAGIIALVLSVVLFAGGGYCIDRAERKAEKIPAITDNRGNTYYTKVYTITNHYKDIYYSVPLFPVAKEKR